MRQSFFLGLMLVILSGGFLCRAEASFLDFLGTTKQTAPFTVKRRAVAQIRLATSVLEPEEAPEPPVTAPSATVPPPALPTTASVPNPSIPPPLVLKTNFNFLIDSLNPNIFSIYYDQDQPISESNPIYIVNTEDDKEHNGFAYYYPDAAGNIVYGQGLDFKKGQGQERQNSSGPINIINYKVSSAANASTISIDAFPRARRRYTFVSNFNIKGLVNMPQGAAIAIKLNPDADKYSPNRKDLGEIRVYDPNTGSLVYRINGEELRTKDNLAFENIFSSLLNMQVSGDALGEATGDIVSHFSLNKLFPSLNALQATLAFTNMQRDLMEETQVNAFTNSSDWNKEISQNSDFSGTTVTVTGSQDVQDQVNQDRDAKTEELRSLMLQATGTLAEAKQELQQLTNNQATIRDDLKSINQKIDNLEEKIKNAKGDKKEELKEKLNDLNKTQQELKSSQTTVRQNLQNAEAEKKEAKTALNQAANNFNTYVSTVAVVPEIKSSNSNKKKK
jgi:hypothetical protein